MPSGDTAHSDGWRGPTARGVRRQRRVTAGMKPVGIERLEQLLAPTLGQFTTTSLTTGSLTLENSTAQSCQITAWADGFVTDGRSHPTVAVFTAGAESLLAECAPTADATRWDVTIRARWARRD